MSRKKTSSVTSEQFPASITPPALPAALPAALPTDPLWTPQQMADALGGEPKGFTVWSVRRLHSTGQLPGKIVLHKLRFTRKSYDQFIASITEVKTPFGRRKS